MNSTQFLRIGGIVLGLIAILGFMGVLGPTAADSPFGPAWYFDNPENWAHLVLGIAMIALGFGRRNETLQKNVTILIGVLGILFAVYNLFSESFLGAGLQNPGDMLLHLAVGVWALSAGTRKPAQSAAPPSMGAA